MTLLHLRHDLGAVPFVGGLLVHLPEARTAHVLNASAAAILSACEEPCDAGGVVQLVASRLGLRPEAIQADVNAAIDQMLDQGILVHPLNPGQDEGSPREDDDGRSHHDDHISGRVAGASASNDAATVSIRVLGRSVSLQFDDPAVAELVVELLAPMVIEGSDAPDDPGADLYRLIATDDAWSLLLEPSRHHRPGDGSSGMPGTTVVLRSGTLDHVAHHLLWRLNHSAIERHDENLLLHAGAVAGTGGAVLIVGHPDAGKSTLTAASVRSGLSYLTDEAARLTWEPTSTGARTLVVNPYPKAISLDTRSMELLGLEDDQRVFGHVPATALGPIAEEPVPVVAVVFPDRSEAATESSLDPVDAVMRMAEQSFTLHRAGTAGLEVLAHLAESIPVLVVPTIDLESAVARIGRLTA